MTKRPFLRRLAVAALAGAAVLVPGPSRAESHDPQCLAFGWLTETADAVVVGVASQDRRAGETGPWELTFTIEDSIRGKIAAPATATVAVPDYGGGKSYVLGRRHLAFLRALPRREGESPRYEPLSGAFGIREIPDAGPEARFPGLCREIAAVLDESGAVRDAAAYRGILVTRIDDVDDGVAWSAATDLVRHAELHAALTAEEKRRVVASFERRPVGNDAKKALALAASATRDPSAAPALVRSLLLPNAWTIRIEVGEALRRLGDPAATPLLLAALNEAGPEHRSDVLNALGAVAPASAGAAAAVRDRLADPSSAVRIEAAHALGLIARAMHRADPPLPLVGRAELVRMITEAATVNEQIASTWALAQFDEPEAYDALRRFAVADERELVRKSAERYLANPRLSLILR